MRKSCLTPIRLAAGAGRAGELPHLIWTPIAHLGAAEAVAQIAPRPSPATISFRCSNRRSSFCRAISSSHRKGLFEHTIESRSVSSPQSSGSWACSSQSSWTRTTSFSAATCGWMSQKTWDWTLSRSSYRAPLGRRKTHLRARSEPNCPRCRHRWQAVSSGTRRLSDPS